MSDYAKTWSFKHPSPWDYAYFMNGAGGQYTFIVPSRGLVIARLGHFRGERRGLRPAFEHAMALLLAAIPK